MSYSLLSITRPTARKQHRCIWCGQAIEPGDTYTRENSIYDGDFQYLAWHPECEQASQQDFIESLNEDFSPYCNERPGKLEVD